MASVRRRDPNDDKSPWVVEYTDKGGKRRRATPKSGLKRDAERLRTKIESELETHSHIARSQTITMNEAIDLYIEKCELRVKAKDNMRPFTLHTVKSKCRKYIRPQLGGVLLINLNGVVLQKFIDDIFYERPEKPLSSATVKGILSYLSMILADMKGRGFVARNVVSEAEYRLPGRAPKPSRIPTKDEIRKILHALDKGGQGVNAKWLKPAVYIAVFSGLRQGEIRALQWQNVDFAAGIIRVREGADWKGTHDDPKTLAGIRDVNIAAPLSLVLKEHWMRQGRPSKGLVVCSRDGNSVAGATVWLSWRRLQSRALEGGSVKKLSSAPWYRFHELRHVAASLFIETGLPPKRIQTLMGHTSVKMTFDRYGHLFDNPAMIDSAMQKMGDGLV